MSAAAKLPEIRVIRAGTNDSRDGVTMLVDTQPTPRQRHDWALLVLMNGEKRAREFRPDLAELFPEQPR